LLPQEVLALAGSEAPTLSIATVYRALKKLADEGSICPVALVGEPVRYEAAGRGHHHHFQCRECRRVYDVAGSVGDLGGLCPPGFTLEDHEVILYEMTWRAPSHIWWVASPRSKRPPSRTPGYA
jgi:Fur family ferric uptake transcriptional regulator